MPKQPTWIRSKMDELGLIGVSIMALGCLLSGTGGAIWGAHLTNDAAARQARAGVYADYISAEQDFVEKESAMAKKAGDTCLHNAVYHTRDSACALTDSQRSDLLASLRTLDAAYYRLLMLGEPDVVSTASKVRSQDSPVTFPGYPQQDFFSARVARDVLRARDEPVSDLATPDAGPEMIRAMTCDVGKHAYLLKTDVATQEVTSEAKGC